MISYTGIEINGDYSKLMGNHPTTGERLISEKHIDNVVIETFNKYLGDRKSTRLNSSHTS